jgi:hypothetical protein
MSFLIDTDICSAYLKSGGQLASRFFQHSGQLRLSVITGLLQIAHFQSPLPLGEG